MQPVVELHLSVSLDLQQILGHLVLLLHLRLNGALVLRDWRQASHAVVWDHSFDAAIVSFLLQLLRNLIPMNVFVKVERPDPVTNLGMVRGHAQWILGRHKVLLAIASIFHDVDFAILRLLVEAQVLLLG